MGEGVCWIKFAMKTDFTQIDFSFSQNDTEMPKPNPHLGIFIGTAHKWQENDLSINLAHSEL